jgi:hypothetical protein
VLHGAYESIAHPNKLRTTATDVACILAVAAAALLLLVLCQKPLRNR